VRFDDKHHFCVDVLMSSRIRFMSHLLSGKRPPPTPNQHPTTWLSISLNSWKCGVVCLAAFTLGGFLGLLFDINMDFTKYENHVLSNS
jgi:hypothetical protein